MILLLCRNRVENFLKWKEVFDSHKEVHRASGLHVKGLWHVLHQPNEVFFLFEVTDLVKAQEFINTPKAAETGRQSGVLEGEYHFLESGTGT